MAQWLILLVVLVPAAGAATILLTQHRFSPSWTAVIFSVATAIIALLLLPYASDSAALVLPILGVSGASIPDGLGLFLTLVAALIGCLAVIFSVAYMRGEAQQGRYYALVLIFISAMCGLVLTDSLLVLFIFWEITALCSYALISFHNDEPAAVAGGIRALVVTQLGGIGLLVGILFIRAYLGTDQISVVLAEAQWLPPGVMTLVAFGFLLAAAAKSAQFPFHIWLPGAMEAPTPISALIHAATMVNAGVYLLARFYPAFSGVPGWTDAILLVGLITALIGGLMALVANDLKRVLAYSTISQLGFMVYAVGIGAIFASQYHLMSHAVFKALLFLGAGAVIHAVGTRDMRLMGGLRRQMPFTCLVFAIGALALSGIPIVNGFWSKELILEQSAEHAPAWASLVMMFVVGLTALYTLRMTWMVFFGQPRSALHGHDATPAMQIALGLLAVGTVTTWLLATPFGEVLETTLPFHTIHLSEDLFGDIVRAPVTWIALLTVGIGIALWYWRSAVLRLLSGLERVKGIATSDFGFEWLSQQIVRWTNAAAEAIRNTQTGQLNWNVAQILVGLIVVLALLALGGNG